jgi:ABC-type dipeptide/oligopeptide/nickel transport system permease subunit
MAMTDSTEAQEAAPTSGGQWTSASGWRATWVTRGLATGPVRTMRRLLATGSGCIGVAVVGGFVVMAIFAPELAPHNPETAYTSYPLAGPSLRFPLGTDTIGRDQLSRLIYATRPALVVSIVAVGVGAVIGVVLGILAGYFQGLFDAVTSRIWDALFGIPVIVLAGAVVLAFGESAASVAIALAVGLIAGFARLARAQTHTRTSRHAARWASRTAACWHVTSCPT